MNSSKVSRVSVCQLIGSMVSDRVPASEECAIRISRHLDAQCFTLHAPAVLSSPQLANALRSEPTIASQLQRLEALDVALFSVGNTAPDTHMVAAGIASNAEMEAAERAGAVGVLCCRYLAADGNPIVLPPADRIIGITVEQLKRANRKFLITAGKDKCASVAAALNGELVTHLCVDEALAEALLATQA